MPVDQDVFISADMLDEAQITELTDPEEEEIYDVVQDIPDELEEEEEDDAFNFVVGFVGRKLGYQPSEIEKPDSWISLKGQGNFFEPCSDLINICKISNKYFNAFHGSELKFGLNPVKKLEDLIFKKNPTFPPRVVKLFCKVKFHHRLRLLNAKLKMEKGAKTVRSFKQMAQFLN